MERRQFLALSLGALAVGQGWAAPAALAPGAAINKAGRQRMLSQRLAKAYAMQVLGVMPDKGALFLDQSRRLFEGQLSELKTYTPSEPIRDGLAALERNWQAYRDALGRERTADNARLVLVESDKTLRAAHALTGLYEKQAAGSAGHLVNLAGRQRMLSQRLAKCFLLQQSGLADEALRGEQEAARREFVAALAELNASPDNTPEIKAELALANTQWLFFEQALAGRETGEAGRLAARTVVTTSERLLEVMDGLTGRYESLQKG